MSLIDTLRTSGALVLYLDFRSGNTYDYSGNNATVTLTAPKWNNKGLFVSVGTICLVSDKPSLQITTGTIVWFGQVLNPATGFLIAKSSGGTRNYYLDGGATALNFRSESGLSSLAYTTFSGKRYAAVNFENNVVPNFYVDGSFVGNGGSAIPVIASATNIGIGSLTSGSNATSSTTSACLIINRKLTATEHARLFGELQAMKWPTKTITRAKPIKNIGLPWDNLLSSFELQQQGATVYDAGTVQNNAATIIGPPWFSRDRMGKVAEFYTPSNNLSIQNSDNAAYTFEYPVTMSAWYRPKTVGSPTQAQIVGRGYRPVEGSSTPLNQGVYVLSDSKIHFKMNSSNLDLPSAASDILRVGVWTHVAATYDGVNATLYINGQQSAQTPYSTSWAETSRRLVIGGEPSVTGSCPGHIADCKYWQRALTAPEILQEYQRGARAQYSVGAVKQQSLAASGSILGGFWTNRTTTGVTGVESVSGRVVTYAQANAASILRLVGYPVNNKSGLTNYGNSSAGQVTSGQNCFGTWQWTVNKVSDTSTVRLVPMLNSTSEWDAGGSINGYLLEIDANEAIGLYRITNSAKASTIMLSANGYITRSVWHKIKLTRAVNGTFTLYVDDVLVPTSSGANPGSDTTYLTGYDICQVSLTDGDKFALSCNTGACNYIQSIGVI